jgi:hypothetical protein
MNAVSVTYALKYELKCDPAYKVTECRRVYNSRTGRWVSRCYNAGSVGYWINRKWYNIKTLRLQKISKSNCPF